MKKRAQGLSLTTIVIAALALIVLVVLVLIFTGRMGGFAQGLDTVTSCENSCKAVGKNVSDGGFKVTCSTTTELQLPGITDDKNQKCCCLK